VCQSTQPAVLADLGRRHGTMAHDRGVPQRHEGFRHVEMTSSLASRAESLEDVAHTLEDLLGLESPPRNQFATVDTEPVRRWGGPWGHPDEDESADAYELVSGTLEATAISGRRSRTGQARARVRHNHVYWDQDDYVGFGSAAHSHRHGRRFWNVRQRPIATSHGARRHTAARGEESSTRERRRSSATRWRCARPRGVPLEALTHSTRSLHLVSVADGRVTLAPNGRLLAISDPAAGERGVNRYAWSMNSTPNKIPKQAGD